ncbi:PQ-loop repeat-containing protein [Sporobolomyces salmoneus]|uniref:PQ-loop repeat-containing protein n=1 Tax=Sporobolomyces salmoneus TaxID=183962 RepID=UPI00317A304D
MPLSTLDLVSTCCGRLSFGFSLWYALPQIGKLYEEKSGQDGPSFQFLTMWLVGDIAQTIGLFAIGGLSTQKASGICFAVSSLIIMLQQLYYRGYVPLTGRYKARIRKPVISQLVTTTHREPAYTIDPPTNDPEHTQFVKSLLNRANDLEKGHKTSRTYKQRSIEKKVPRDKKRVRSKAKKGWIKADGKSFNFTGFFLVTVVMMIVWFKVDFENRKTTNLELAPFPGTLAEWVGWALGWIGTALYNYPRVHQLIGIQLSKSVSSLAAFMFASLVLQNITILISIAAVSHTLETAPAQAPYYTNLACALTSDVIAIPRPISSLSQQPELEKATLE